MSIERTTSLHSCCKLVVFSFVLLSLACFEKKDTNPTDVSIIWKDGRASGISIPKRVLESVAEDSLPSLLQVRLSKQGEQPAIAGEYSVNQHQIIFQPLIPFTRGLRYEVIVKHQSPILIEIPKSTEAPKLLAVYPSQDTVPENLLKIYLEFSQPMSRGHSLEYVRLFDQKGDSLPNTFLNLQQELWNEEGTVLTLWLDPGRIKRDLQPNKLLGPPLVEGKAYKLTISSEWPDEQGTPLQSGYTKNIVAATRDTARPAPADWNLKLPTAGTPNAFEMDLREPHDYLLLQSTIQLIDPNGNVVQGNTIVSNGERRFSFTPTQPWSPGTYKLRVDSRLEDLAGNNLSRLFDRDLTRTEKTPPVAEIYEREWKITR